MTEQDRKPTAECRALTPAELDAVSGGALDAYLQIGGSSPSQQKPDGSSTTACCNGTHYDKIIVVC
jgi:hypothetical protein